MCKTEKGRWILLLAGKERIIAMAEQDKKSITMGLSDLQRLCGITEDMDFDVPFATFSWTYWQEAQTRMFLGFGRFQRAISNRQLQLATLIALEMQQVVMDLQKEICSWLEPGVKGEQEK